MATRSITGATATTIIALSTGAAAGLAQIILSQKIGNKKVTSGSVLLTAALVSAVTVTAIYLLEEA